MQRTQIYLPKSQVDQLKQEAHKKATTVSQVVRFFIGTGLGESMAEGSKKPSLLSFAKQINKKGLRAPKDLASRADAYLYGDN